MWSMASFCMKLQLKGEGIETCSSIKHIFSLLITLLKVGFPFYSYNYNICLFQCVSVLHLSC